MIEYPQLLVDVRDGPGVAVVWSHQRAGDGLVELGHLLGRVEGVEPGAGEPAGVVAGQAANPDARRGRRWWLIGHVLVAFLSRLAYGRRPAGTC